MQAQNVTSPAISRYGDYLEGVYSNSPVSSDGKFPPTPSKTYVNLAVVEHASEVRDIEEVRKNVLHGRVDEMVEGKIKIKLTDILKPWYNGICRGSSRYRQEHSGLGAVPELST